MEQKIKHVTKLLRIQYLLFLLLPVLQVVANECDWLDVGGYADNVLARYYLESATIILSIVSIPLALKLFSLVLKKKISSEKSSLVAIKKYLWWSGIRLLILEIAVLFSFEVYYLTLSNVGGLCALIGLTASVFCLPSEKRLREEMNIY